MRRSCVSSRNQRCSLRSSSRSGLGYEISNSLQAFETPTAWAAVAILGGLGITWHTLLGGVERIVVPWAAAQRNR